MASKQWNITKMILIKSPVFIPDPKENIVPFQYVLEKTIYGFVIYNMQWYNNQWNKTVFNTTFNPNELEKAITQLQNKIDNTITKQKVCQYQYKIQYEDPQS